MPVLVKPKNFNSEVLETELPVLVDFFGERCTPCQMLRPILLELSEEYTGQLKVCMFNTDREARDSDADYEEKFRTALTYGVMHLPTLLLFVGGALKRTLIGLHSKDELLAIFKEESLALEPGISDDTSPDSSEDTGHDQQDSDNPAL